MANREQNDNGALQILFDLIARLRGPNGCPWDREQTADNILSDLIEETYELQWAHAQDDVHGTLDELGDVVFVLVFAISLLHERDRNITLSKLAQHAYDKIYRRHPHVFGDSEARNKAEGLAHWERVKEEERATRKESNGLFEDIPGTLPPLRRAEKIQRRAARTGFDWDDARGILAKIREETDEVEEALAGDNRARIEHEVGDLFFSVMNLSRFLNVDAEKALTATNAKFVSRYKRMEKLIAGEGRSMDGMTLDELDRYWEQAKQDEQ